MKNNIRAIALILCCVLCSIACVGCGFFGDSDSPMTVSKKKTVMVTLNPNGGNVNQITLIGYPGDALTLPVPTREGYVFDKWYNDYQLISQTVFPEEDVTLTARYYAEHDSEKRIQYTSELNKSMTNWYFLLTEFSSDEQEKIKYLQKNHTTEIAVVCTFEGYLYAADVARWLGADGTFTLCGANVIDSVSTNASSWTQYTLSANKTGAELVNEGSGILRLIARSDWNATPYFRNFQLTITYVEKAGTLV